MAALELRGVTKRFGDAVAVDRLSVAVEEGEFLILVGPSGCGKTTALRMVAGLEDVSEGEITIGGRVVNDLAPSSRDIAMVFQNYALYPHMSVADNMAFPLQQQRLKRSEIRARVAETARLLEIGSLLERRPRELSGGQRQRVAIGRALVRRPRAFLMDEPLSNLDAKLRVQMRAELLSLHRRLGITTIYVTHDQTEAMTLGDRVLVLDKGVMQQLDTPQRLYRDPANTFVATFIGSPSMNLFEGTVERGRLHAGPIVADLDAAEGRVLVGLRPEGFTIAADSAGFDAEVAFTEQLGPETLVYFYTAGLQPRHVRRDVEDVEGRPRDLDALLVARIPADVDVPTRTRFAINASGLRLYDVATGEALDHPAAAGRLRARAGIA